jgi:hypothetical protein
MMAKSYKKIDYRLRPAKAVERRMLADVFRKLEEFGTVADYRYVGFGSVYFSDFVLFHRNLGFKKMTSIEHAVVSREQERFKLNVPFGLIEMVFARSTLALQQLSEHERCVIWLDYDGYIDASILADIQTVCQKAANGCFMAITLNASDPKHTDDEDNELTGLEALKKLIPNELIPANTTEASFSGWGTAKILREITINKIADSLNTINGVRSQGSKKLFKQVVNFHYQDGARMVTVGGVFIDEGQIGTYRKCMFEALDYVRQEENPYLIDPPKFTLAEMRQINILNNNDADKLKALPLPPNEVSAYLSLYRYFPNFVEAEL